MKNLNMPYLLAMKSWNRHEPRQPSHSRCNCLSIDCFGNGLHGAYPMSRQPPEDSLQFGRQNSVRLAADVAREAIEKVMQNMADESGVVLIRPPRELLNLPSVQIDAELKRTGDKS